MDKKEKSLLAMSIFAIILSGCTTSNTDGGPYRVGQAAQNQGVDGNTVGSAGVTHTHNGVAHTHRLPEGGLKHSHNIGTGNTNRTCQPCGTNTVRRQPATTNTGGNCHTHAGRRHCHALPTTGTNHQHNTGAGSSNNTFVNTQPPIVNRQPQAQPPVNNTTYYDYTNTGTPANTGTPTNTGNTNYYDPAPASKGNISHSHNGRYHSHQLPATGVNHNHNDATSFGGSYNNAQPSSTAGSGFYNGGTNTYAGSSSSSSYTPSSGSCDTASGNYYIVKPKDGVYRIGVNNGVKRNDIIRLNNLQMPDYTIQPGQCLRLR